MLDAIDIFDPQTACLASFSSEAVQPASDTRSPTPPRHGATSPRSFEDDEPDRADAGPIDARVFRPEVFDAVWPRIVGVRAAQARRALTPEAWRRAWLNGYAHLRECDPDFYAATPDGAARAIAVLAPLMRRIAVDFRKSDAANGLPPRTLAWARCAPSAATLLRWQEAEADTRVRASRTAWSDPERLHASRTTKDHIPCDSLSQTRARSGPDSMGRPES